MTDHDVHLAVAQSADNAIVKSRQQHGNFVEGRVCGSCNKGWMHELEKEAMACVKALIDARVSHLSLSVE